ncbi:hypothetical protein K504DRAFT_529431 [Pleomassaria siparia CBS 279.74]|uniref:Uncharacterized protein n=1 Tax=Pleomassaria siparia CBS 279.74 TaxID=1314801 RepID=A0A6G1KQW6_9PLEO|nr:hypothetical protein K504DRAFT_529431 [Pleomassaria siparia CBS 279.74]
MYDINNPEEPKSYTHRIFFVVCRREEGKETMLGFDGRPYLLPAEILPHPHALYDENDNDNDESKHGIQNERICRQHSFVNRGMRGGGPTDWQRHFRVFDYNTKDWELKEEQRIFTWSSTDDPVDQLEQRIPRYNRANTDGPLGNLAFIERALAISKGDMLDLGEALLLVAPSDSREDTLIFTAEKRITE